MDRVHIWRKHIWSYIFWVSLLSVNVIFLQNDISVSQGTLFIIGMNYWNICSKQFCMKMQHNQWWAGIHLRLGGTTKDSLILRISSDATAHVCLCMWHSAIPNSLTAQVSPCLAENICLEMWFYMYKSSVGLYISRFMPWSVSDS